MSTVVAPETGVSVSPAIVKLDLQEISPEATLTYHNATSQTVEITLSAADVTELEEGYKPEFLDVKNSQNYRYKLSDWLQFSQTSIVLKSNESGTIQIRVNQEKLTPGGHYGSVLAHVSAEQANTQVQVQAILASLIFVRAHTGKEIEQADVVSLTPMRYWLDFPGALTLRINNTGNTDITPYGKVEITDVFGRVVATGILNKDSLVTLPESVRSYTFPLEKGGLVLLPSRYIARMNLHFGKTEQQRVVVSSFFSPGSAVFVATPFVLILVLGVWMIAYRKRLRHLLK